ncbi:MAG: ferredoxin [Actinomycetota bacterium]
MAEIEIDGVRYRVLVDHGLCMGTRVCSARAPQVFAVDDATNLSSPLPGEVDGGLADAVREAVGDCPQEAISLERID